MTRSDVRRARGRRPGRPPDPDDLGWVEVVGALVWLVAILAAIPIGLLLGTFAGYVGVGLAGSVVDHPPEGAVFLGCLVGTPCLLVALTVWAAMAWARRRTRTTTSPTHR